MPPSLAQYQAAASQIYDPLQQGELGTASAAHTGNIATLEGQKAGVGQSYSDSIYDLQKTTDSNAAKIAQQYTLALGGNFSGLQGNDMGMMFSDAAHTQGSIAAARDNALNDIGTKETNETMNYNANVGAIQNKYASQKTQYAQDQYGSAVAAYNQSLIDQQKMAIEQQKANASSYSAYKGSAPSAAAIKQQDMSTIASALQGKAGKDGHVSQETWNAAMASWIGAGYNAKDFTGNFQQFINQKYKGYHGYS